MCVCGVGRAEKRFEELPTRAAKAWRRHRASIKAYLHSLSRCPRPVLEHRDTELAVTEIALVAAVGETRGKLAQVAFTDRLAAQRAETLWTRAPAVHQDEFHIGLQQAATLVPLACD